MMLFVYGFSWFTNLFEILPQNPYLNLLLQNTYFRDLVRIEENSEKKEINKVGKSWIRYIY